MQKILQRTLTILTLVCLGGIFCIGLVLLVFYGPIYPTELLQLGPYRIVGLPFSYVIFSGFGILLFKKFGYKAPLLLGATYASWELLPQVAQSLIAPNTGSGNPFDLAIWVALVLGGIYLLKPRIELVPWITLATIFFYAETPQLEAYVQPVFLVELASELVWCAFVWCSFYPEQSARGKPVFKKEIVVNEKSALVCEPR